ncbi:MAG: family 20 glycosylhydrolase, partial [Spirochaetales bacterium]|nr:family 20 glycosylhydrolase [Candidatus Physcosoma equi]
NQVKITADSIQILAKGQDEERQGRAYVQQLELLFEGKLPETEFEFCSPVHAYRGFHIDVVRHFMSIKELKRIISAMALVGFNYFHWHLTDDQGWRFPVPGYDKLESISSQRRKQTFDDERNVHKGFYSLEDLKDIESFCFEKGITVIPEVEMPGHAEALLAAYPEFGCTGKKIEVQDDWGIFENVMNPASPELWAFLEETIKVLASVFHGPYIHIGGDECPHVQWDDHPGCRSIMDENHLETTNELQGWFTTKAAALVAKYGKRAIGWDEVIDAPAIDKSVVVMSWRGLDGARIAAGRGHEVILAPQNGGCYLDRYQTEDDFELGNWSMGKAKEGFDLDMSMKELPEEQRKLVLGGQCNLWCEKIHTGREAEYMLFPRAFIIAENLWLDEKKDWESLKARKKAMADLCYALDLVCSPARWE